MTGLYVGRCVLQTYAGLWVALHLPPSSPPSWSPHIPHLPILFILNFHLVTLAMMTLDFQWHGQHWLQSGFILHDRWHPMPSMKFIIIISVGVIIILILIYMGWTQIIIETCIYNCECNTSPARPIAHLVSTNMWHCVRSFPWLCNKYGVAMWEFHYWWGMSHHCL